MAELRKRPPYRTPEEQAELEEIYERAFRGPVWAYFKQVKRIRRPFNTTTDWEPGPFIPD